MSNLPESVRTRESDKLLQIVRDALVFVNDRFAAVAPQLESGMRFHEVGIESVELLEMAAYIEDTLAIHLDDRGLIEASTLHDLIELMKREVAES